MTIDDMVRAVLENGDTCSCETGLTTTPPHSVTITIGLAQEAVTARVRDWIRAAYELGRADAGDATLGPPCVSDTSPAVGSGPGTKPEGGT